MSTRLTTPLRTWRETHGLSLQDVAALTGLHASTVSRVERGQRDLTALRKVAVARHLGTPVAVLFHPTDPGVGGDLSTGR